MSLERNKKPWKLIRQDESGNKFVIDSFESKEKAEQEMEKFQKRGHKQTYWVQEKR